MDEKREMTKPMDDKRLAELKQYVIPGSTYPQDIRLAECVDEIERLRNAYSEVLDRLWADGYEDERLRKRLEAAEKVCGWAVRLGFTVSMNYSLRQDAFAALKAWQAIKAEQKE